MALTDKLTAIANGFRTSRGTQDKYTLDQMAVLAAEKVGADPVINPLSITANGTYTASDCDGYSPITVAVPQEGAPTAEELTITGNIDQRFAYGTWDWVIKKYGNQITTKDLISCLKSFLNCSSLTDIPFEFNYKPNTSVDFSQMFYGCRSLKSLANTKFNNSTPSDLSQMFNGCGITEFSGDVFANTDWSKIDGATSAYSASCNGIFSNCNWLRKVDVTWLHGNPVAASYSSVYSNAFQYCRVLDEIVDLPVIGKMTSTCFGSTLTSCHRLKNFTFAINPETNAPYTAEWQSQTINFRTDVTRIGTAQSPGDVTMYGIDASKEVKDDATYQALKNDPDWFTTNPAYCRYNWDSAVATVNSLPDTSAYLAANSGKKNTIIFSKDSGSATDGGSFSTHTDEEVAALVALADSKGWTISLP